MKNTKSQTDVLAAIDHAAYRKQFSNEALRNDVRATAMRANIKRREITLKAAIAGELGEDGKALYSNEPKRDAELVRRWDLNEESLKMQSEMESQENDAAGNKIDAQYHADMIRILCAFSDSAKAVQ